MGWGGGAVGEEVEDRERGERGEAEYVNEVRLFIGKLSVFFFLFFFFFAPLFCIRNYIRF